MLGKKRCVNCGIEKELYSAEAINAYICTGKCMFEIIKRDKEGN